MTMDINSTVEGVEAFGQIDPNMSLTAMLVFLFVARRGICNQQDIEIGLGLTSSSATRNVAYWSEAKTFSVPGQGFVVREEDPRDRRSKLVRLTPKGKAFYHKLQGRSVA